MRFPTAVLVLTVGCLAAALSACGDSATNDSQPSPTAFASKVQTPVAQAQEAGITIYWLGERIEAVGEDFRWTGNATYGQLANELPAFDFEYWEIGRQPTLYVVTFPPDETHDARRQMWLDAKSAMSEPVELSGWSGEIISVLEDDGEFRIAVFLHGEEAGVRISTTTTGEHILTSPLSDPEQLLAIIEDNLRPFPE